MPQRIERILLCNIGWSDEYRGGLLKGTHKYIRKTKGDGGERWNFRRHGDNKYRGWFRGVGGHWARPKLEAHQRTGWTIVFYARDPEDAAPRPVGYYRNATILPDEKPMPGVRGHHFNVIAPVTHSRLLPPHLRTLSFAGAGRLGRAAFCYITDPESGKVKPDFRRHYAVIQQLLSGKLPARETTGSRSPITQDAEHRRRVEQRSVGAAQKWLRERGWATRSVERECLGYDLVAEKRVHSLHVEVKGTASGSYEFLMTPREFRSLGRDPEFRLLHVRHALAPHPSVTLFTAQEVRSAFRVLPFQFLFRPRRGRTHKA